MNKTLLTAEDEKEEESSFGQLMTADVDLHVGLLSCGPNDDAHGEPLSTACKQSQVYIGGPWLANRTYI